MSPVTDAMSIAPPVTAVEDTSTPPMYTVTVPSVSEPSAVMVPSYSVPDAMLVDALLLEQPTRELTMVYLVVPPPAISSGVVTVSKKWLTSADVVVALMLYAFAPLGEPASSRTVENLCVVEMPVKVIS